MTRTRPTLGFTLLELLVALAVVAILLGVGVPSFVEMVRESRIGAASRALHGSLRIARSESLKRGELVSVCPRAAADTCGGAGAWSNGWIVFADPSAKPGDGVARVDEGDEVVQEVEAVHGSIDIVAYGTRTDATAMIDPAAFLRFQPRGAVEWSAGASIGSLLVCDDVRGNRGSRVLNVQSSGDVRVGRPGPERGAALDVRDLPIDCEANRR